MLSDLTEKIGVVIFFNTTVGSEAIYFDIYDELYKYGQKLKNATLTDR
jgi:hypothetical protein